MPQMANIIVKDAANADVTFVALTPASGDTTQAQWRATALATVPSNAPAVATKTNYNGPKTGRLVSLNAVFPHVETVSGVETVVAKQPFSFNTTVPLNIPRTAAVKHATIVANLFKAAIIQEILADGYNAT